MVNSLTSERAKQFLDKYSEIIELWDKGTDPFRKAMAATLKEAAQGSEAQ